MRLLLIDDHLSFCEGLKAALLSARPDYQVDYEADANWVPQSILGKTQYDLFIMDLMMPGMGGMELIRFLNANHHQTPIVVLSSVEDPVILSQLLDLGVMGYLPKSYSVFQILDAIDECCQGRVHVPAFLAAGLSNGGCQGVNRANRASVLTPRQLEILSLLDKGLSNQGIADYLFISKATVKTHINQLFKALEAKNRVNCLRQARQLGFLPH